MTTNEAARRCAEELFDPDKTGLVNEYVGNMAKTIQRHMDELLKAHDEAEEAEAERFWRDCK